MSGVFTYRVNRSWNRAQSNISAAVFFWDWLNYVESHAGLTWIAYGTGKVQTGVTPPASWLNWNPLLAAVPWSDNSWVVFEASNADPALGGGGTMPWQCKLQVTLATGFDDCNVADNDYGYETETYVVAGRASVMGGWNPTTLDFSPATSEPASNNYLWFGHMTASYGQNVYYFLDIVGDDDTLVWKGAAVSSISDLESETVRRQSRGGYLGMIQRRFTDVPYPFLYKVGTVCNCGEGAGYIATNRRFLSGNGEWAHTYQVIWPSYSIWKDKTRVTSHHHDPVDTFSLVVMSPYQETGEEVCPTILLAQWQTPDKYAIIGEYRFLVATSIAIGQHEVFGVDPQYIQMCYDAVTSGGVAMRWPISGIMPIW